MKKTETEIVMQVLEEQENKHAEEEIKFYPIMAMRILNRAVKNGSFRDEHISKEMLEFLSDFD